MYVHDFYRVYGRQVIPASKHDDNNDNDDDDENVYWCIQCVCVCVCMFMETASSSDGVAKQRQPIRLLYDVGAES